MKVSILTAVYNTASYLPQCIESVLAQTHRDWQLICIDDCSTDGSLDIINRYAASDSRITVVRNAENQGQAKARNAGLLHADGEIVTMLDSDDWIAPDALEKIVAAFEGNRDIDCLTCSCIIRPTMSDHTKTPSAIRSRATRHSDCR